MNRGLEIKSTKKSTVRSKSAKLEFDGHMSRSRMNPQNKSSVKRKPSKFKKVKSYSVK